MSAPPENVSTLRFAGITVEVRSLYPDIHTLCADYRAEGVADFTVVTARSDVEFEHAKALRDDALAGRPARRYSSGYLETLAICRKIAERTPDHDTVLFHGSCVAVDGAAYLLTAKSGTGKSTHARLWREFLGDRAVMVNDDKPFIRMTAEGAVAYGSPWDGKHRLSANIAVPLKAVCLLSRAEENSIRPMAVSEAYPLLLPQVYRPMDAVAMGKTLTLLDRLTASVTLWHLSCNMRLAAAKLSYEAMKG